MSVALLANQVQAAIERKKGPPEADPLQAAITTSLPEPLVEMFSLLMLVKKVFLWPKQSAEIIHRRRHARQRRSRNRKIFFARLLTEIIFAPKTSFLKNLKYFGLATVSFFLLSFVFKSVQTSKIRRPTTSFCSPRVVVSTSGNSGMN